MKGLGNTLGYDTTVAAIDETPRFALTPTRSYRHGSGIDLFLTTGSTLAILSNQNRLRVVAVLFGRGVW